MRKTIAIQVTNVREESLLADKQALYEIGIEPIYFGLIPFSDEVTGADSFDSFDEVITYNCLNCSGKYECNRADIFKALLS